MSELSNKTIESLRADLIANREALRTHRFGAAGSRSRNVRGGRELRKSIARILTEMRARTMPVKEKKTAVEAANMTALAKKAKNA